MSCQMVSNLSKLEEVNVLASGSRLGVAKALRHIFKPRGVNLLVAENATEFVNVIRNRRIHTTIVDMDSEHSNGLATVKIIKMDYPLLPSVQLLDFEDIGLLIRHDSLICDSCSSGQRFACGFLQIQPHD